MISNCKVSFFQVSTNLQNRLVASCFVKLHGADYAILWIEKHCAALFRRKGIYVKACETNYFITRRIKT